MFRRHLDDNAGMIFVFPDLAPRNFWMHNTEIPLDMIFADSSFRVTGIVANAAPQTDTLRGVEGASQYVLEVNGGFCAKYGINPATASTSRTSTPTPQSDSQPIEIAQL